MLTPLILVSLLTVCPLHEGKHEQIDAATSAIELAPSDVDLRLARAEIYLLHDDLKACAEDLEVARGMAPQESAVLLLRARLEFAQKEFVTALASTDTFLARKLGGNPKMLALHLRAKCLTALQRPAPAIAAWSQLLEVHMRPQPDWYLQRATLQEAVSKDGTKAAIDGLDQGIKRLGDVVGLVLRAADLEEKLGRIDAAVARIDTLAARSPRKETWLKRQGDILQRAGRREEARGFYQRALLALEKLPTKRRNTFSMLRLGDEIEASLKKLNDE